MEILEFTNLIKHLNSSPDRIKMWAAYQLVENWQERAEDFAGELIESDINEIKESGVYLIGQKNLDQFAFPLFRLFSGSSGRLRQACALALAEIQYENIETPLTAWMNTLLESEELNISDLQCSIQSLLLFNVEKWWTNIESQLVLHYESHIKSLSLFGGLCDAAEYPSHMERLVKHYRYYRTNFTDPQFIQDLISVFESDEIIDFVRARMSCGYSIQLIYKECLNILGWKVSKKGTQILESLDECNIFHTPPDMPQQLISLILELTDDSESSLAVQCLSGFKEIVKSEWNATIIKNQEQEYSFLLALPLTHFIKKAEEECLEHPDQYSDRIARIYHSPLLRFRFMINLLNLFATLGTDNLITSPSPGNYHQDTPKDALWRLITGQITTEEDYPFPSVLPKPWQYDIPQLIPQLITYYQSKFDDYITAHLHEHIDYALELFTKNPDKEILQRTLKHFTFLINQHFHIFFEFIERVPDHQFIPKLVQHYRQGESDIAQLLDLLCVLHDEKNPLQMDDSNEPSPQLQAYARILCPECHASYHYPISVLYFDKEAVEQRRPFKDNDLWTTDILTCKNCHAGLPFKTDNSFRSNLYAEVLTAQLLKLTEEEEKIMESFKPLVFPRYFGKKTNPGVFLKKVQADLNANRLSAADQSVMLLELGKLYLSLEQLDDAREAFEKCLHFIGNQPVALFNLGVIAFRKKNLYDARLHFSRLITICSPHDFEFEEENLYHLAAHYLEILDRREFKRSSFKLVRS